MADTKVDLPEVGGVQFAMAKLKSGESAIVFMRVEHDPDSDNPLQGDEGLGTIRSFCSRHVNYLDRAEFDFDPKRHVRLSYYEHGLCLWFVQRDKKPLDHWDTVHYAGVWRAPELGMDQEEMVKMAKTACQAYTEWCNGEVYRVDVIAYTPRFSKGVEAYDLLSDYRYDCPLYIESCVDILGYDTAEEVLNELLWGAVEKYEGPRSCAVREV